MLFSSSSNISRTSVCPPLSSCQSFPSAPWIDAVRNTYTDAALFLSHDNLFLRRSWHTLDETSSTWKVVEQDTIQNQNRKLKKNKNSAALFCNFESNATINSWSLLRSHLDLNDLILSPSNLFALARPKDCSWQNGQF